LKNFIWLPFTLPLVAYSVIQLVSELVISLVILNRLFDPKCDMEKDVVKLMVFNGEYFGY
jgi:hypothetical protein